MDSVSHIPTDTGINNSVSKPMTMDSSENDDEDQGSYHTIDEMDQAYLFASDNMKKIKTKMKKMGVKAMEGMQIMTTC